MDNPIRYTFCPWPEIQHLELHGFRNASPKVYGAFVYLIARLGDESTVSSLVMSKPKVAPLQMVELLGSHLGAWLIVFVREPLNYRMMWRWLAGQIPWFLCHGFAAPLPGERPNRVSEMQSLTRVDQWSHCHGAENPTDLVTRGIHTEGLVRSTLWLHCRVPSW